MSCEGRTARQHAPQLRQTLRNSLACLACRRDPGRDRSHRYRKESRDMPDPQPTFGRFTARASARQTFAEEIFPLRHRLRRSPHLQKLRLLLWRLTLVFEIRLLGLRRLHEGSHGHQTERDLIEDDETRGWAPSSAAPGNRRFAPDRAGKYPGDCMVETIRVGGRRRRHDRPETAAAGRNVRDLPHL
jgi:hypothetical protein